jgi:(1->4)-alpha-D-glucan 1-alpha-D-glucosylmutase
MAADLRGAAPEDAPDANDDYLFYQAIVGAWPPEFCNQSMPAAARLQEFADRLKQALTKAVREAKRHSSWGASNEEYETGLNGLVDRPLQGSPSNRFLESFIAFQFDVARFGGSNSLVQVVLKLTAPGIPDIYQGAELWDFSLVDPDNRRAVDFAAREHALEALRATSTAHRATTIDDCLIHWQDGRISC